MAIDSSVVVADAADGKILNVPRLCVRSVIFFEIAAVFSGYRACSNAKTWKRIVLVCEYFVSEKT